MRIAILSYPILYPILSYAKMCYFSKIYYTLLYSILYFLQICASTVSSELHRWHCVLTEQQLLYKQHVSKTFAKEYVRTKRGLPHTCKSQICNLSLYHSRILLLLYLKLFLSPSLSSLASYPRSPYFYTILMISPLFYDYLQLVPVWFLAVQQPAVLLARPFLQSLL